MEASLDEICVERVEQAPPSQDPIPYIDISSIDRSTKRIGETDKVTETNAPTRARQRVRENDVLVSMTRPNLNAVAKIGSDLDGAVASTGFDVLRSVEVLPDWVFYRVRTNEFVADVCNGLQGVVYPAIRPHDVRRHRLPIPPLAEQHRIVEAIESYFTRLDDAVATLERVQRNLKRYRASVLKAAVEGRLVPTEADLARAEGRDYEPASVLLERILAERRRRWEENELATMKAQGKTQTDDKWKASYQSPEPVNVTNPASLPEGWTWTSVDAVGDVLLGRQRAPQFLTGRFTRPYLRVANIKDDRVAVDDLEAMDFDSVHFEKYRLEPGDILVSEGQSPELLGQSAIYRGGIDGLCFQKTLHRFRPIQEGPSSDFAQLVFRSHVKSGVFKRLGSITTNIGHLTLIKFKGAPFPLPPAREQERITVETQRILSLIDETEISIRRQVLRCGRLRQSSLKWAFEGRLVDQDPTDEPASALLERIKAERAAAEAKMPAAKRKPSSA
jgi:type I restriction enzyme S subunit